MEKANKKWYQIWWVWLILLSVLGKLIGDQQKSSTSNLSSCVGNQSCISNVRSNFKNSGKQILGEDYLGEGRFGISFLDARRGLTANAKVTTDCNCNVLNVDVSVIR
jgi:hypothetical protein